MYALVQFLVDKVKAVVPAEDIKDFSPDDFDSDAYKLYEVFWKSPSGEGTGYWYAVVLLLAESEELIVKRQKRIKLPPPKKLEELLAMTLKDVAKKSPIDEEIRRKSKDIQEKRSACEKSKLKEILRQKLKENKRKRSPSRSSDGCSKMLKKDGSHSASESSDEDELVLKSEVKRISLEYKKVLHKLKLKQEENIKLKKRNDQLQELNISLQQQLLLLLNKNGNIQKLPEFDQPELPKLAQENNLELVQLVPEVSRKLPELVLPEKVSKNLPEPVPQRVTELVPQFADDERIEAANTEGSVERNVKEMLAPSPVTNGFYLHDNGNLMKWEGDQMELASGIFIKKEQWDKLTTKNINKSRFTRNLAVALWGSEALKGRSVTGSACRRFKKDGVAAKQPLTPIKVDAVQNGLRFWLKEHQGTEEQEVLKLASTVAVRKMLSDKIMDLAKQEKKNLSQTF